MGRLVRLEIQKEHLDAVLPSRKRATDAGYDLTTVESVIIPAHGFADAPTGLRVSAPPGFYYVIESRSCMWRKGLVVHRGIIDGGYTGLLQVGLFNVSAVDQHIAAGDRIAQLILHELLEAEFSEVSEFSPEYTTRGTLGWGSSGR